MDYIGLKLVSEKINFLATACDEGQVSLVYGATYQPGDALVMEVATPGRYCVVQFEDTIPPALVYVKSQRVVFPIPCNEKATAYSPKSFVGNCHIIRARYATPEEIAVRRNLAYNPYDPSEEFGFYPHASSNIEAAKAGYAPRTAIDGVFENAAHLVWPYQGWSNNGDSNAELTLNFGRPVTIDEIRLTLRADFPHDSWWTNATVSFSDGSSETLTLEKSAKPQAFTIAPRTVTSLVLRDLKKAEDESEYTALTQIEAWGVEANI